MNARIYIDEQTARNQWRLRVVVNSRETFAVYLKSRYEAEKQRNFLKKFITSNNRDVAK